MAVAMMSKSATMVRPACVRPTASLKPTVSCKAVPKMAVAAGSRMMVWKADDNKQFETFSFLPPLTKEQIAKQVDYIVNNGWIPCLETASPGLAYVSTESAGRFGTGQPCYYDNRYWTMWKLPMFGCTDPSQVLGEIEKAAKALPNAYIRIAAFDNVRQVQICSFLVHRPAAAKDYLLPQNRQLQ